MPGITPPSSPAPRAAIRPSESTQKATDPADKSTHKGTPVSVSLPEQVQRFNITLNSDTQSAPPIDARKGTSTEATAISNQTHDTSTDTSMPVSTLLADEVQLTIPPKSDKQSATPIDARKGTSTEATAIPNQTHDTSTDTKMVEAIKNTFSTYDNGHELAVNVIDTFCKNAKSTPLSLSNMLQSFPYVIEHPMSESDEGVRRIVIDAICTGMFQLSTRAALKETVNLNESGLTKDQIVILNKPDTTVIDLGTSGLDLSPEKSQEFIKSIISDSDEFYPKSFTPDQVETMSAQLKVEKESITSPRDQDEDVYNKLQTKFGYSPAASSV